MKKIISVLLLLAFIGLETAPSYAFLRSRVSKNEKVEQQKKADKEEYKRVQKQKDIPYKKLKVENKYDYINMPWWEGFNDSYLTGYIDRAMEHNYDLKMATLTVDEYFQSVKLRMSEEMPQAQAGFGYGAARLPKIPMITEGSAQASRSPIPLPLLSDRTVHGMGVPLLASYEVDIFLKNHDKTKAQKKLFEASISDERATYIAIASAVGTVYYNIVKLDKVISLQEDIVDLRKNIYDMMVLSHENGITSTSDMIKANKLYIAGQTDLIDLKRTRQELLNQLAVLIGDSPANTDEYERISYDKIQYKCNIPDEIVSDIIMERPDYHKAEVLLKKAGIDVRVAKKEFLPTISISGLALFGSKNFGSLFTTNNALAALSGSAMLPLFTGGARIANLKMSKVRMEKALRNYQKTNIVAIQEVNDTLYAAKMDNKKLEQNKEHLRLETQDFSLTEKRLEQGVISRLDWCQMRENLLTVQKLVASNTLDCMIDEINIYKATGTKY